MAKVTLNGKEYDLVLNNFTMYHYGKAMGVDTPIEAINTLSLLKDGHSFEAQERLSKFVHYCTKQRISIEDCFELLNDRAVLESVYSEIEKYLSSIIPMNSDTSTEKKKEAVT